MANLSIVLDGLALHTEPNGPYLAADDGQGIDWGSQEVADALLTGMYRPEEYDQVAAEQGLRRTVTIPMRIRSASADTARTQEQALIQKLTGATIYSPKLLVVVPQGSTHTSTFTVFGGAWQSTYTQTQSNTNTIAGTLTLVCDWPVLGATQNLGSAGSPLVSNTASPASVTVTPTADGDAPGDVTLFVKNRAASVSARSLMVGTVSGNTTWTALVDSSTWTLGVDGTRITTDTATKNTDMVQKTGTLTSDTVYSLASWTAPTLPSDRRFTVWLRTRDASGTGGFLQFRLRHVTGAVEVVGGWRSVPIEANSSSWVGVKMGSWPFPPGSVSSAGAASTTTYLELLSLNDVTGALGIKFDYALYMPEDSTITFETADTTKTIAAAGGTVMVEADQLFSTSGVPAGGVAVGSHVRARGASRYVVHLSQGYLGALDPTIYWDFQPVDVYATYVPRFIGLA